MDSSPQQPEHKKDDQRAIITPAQWLKHNVLTPQESSISSVGEFFIPTLVAAMETCWIDAILIGLASINLFASSEPLMPFWAPLILIGGSQWLLYYTERRAARNAPSQAKDDAKIAGSANAIFIGFVFILALFLTWLYIYAPEAFLLDPRWILALINDILLLNLKFFQVVAIIALSFLFGWRGIQLSQRVFEPYHIFRELCMGLGIIVVVIVLRAGQESTGATSFHYDLTLLLLIPIFLFLSLSAHALARVAFIRRTHPAGLQGSIVVQERAIMMVIGSIGLALLVITLILGNTISPTILKDTLGALAPLGAVYQWLVLALAYVAAVIVTPFFWLASWWFSLFPHKFPTIRTPKGQVINNKIIPPPSNTSPEVILASKIILPILLLLAIFFLLRWALLRRRSIRVRTQRRSPDIHESLWSWSLFWMQFKSFLHDLLRRLFPQRATQEEKQETWEEITGGEPTARTIREIYRSLLKKAAYRGYARKKDETPYEFKQRLDDKVPLAEPQLEVITEAYALTRYGGNVPDEAEVAHVSGVWAELDQKWS